ncbi:MAG TPA: hypothetical protein DCE41_29250 [Cytophagales bacterium]|nr:hypothetical protein [Cytophagales bacterium]HAA18026.1 hypothetical protein [Cytophagales bacterium]HAP63066.1 hypothetical protein [Cytophagales bacterium]
MEFSLTPEEASCLSDDLFLITKRRVVEKNVALLFQLQEPIQDWGSTLTGEFHRLFLGSREGKVSTGENYQGLPYQIFDYPRIFDPENTFALRTMIWWGRGVSTVLHLAGDVWEATKEQVLQQLLTFPNDYVVVGDDPWQHHFGPDNFVQISALSGSELAVLADKKFFKIGQRWPLEERGFLLKRVNETVSRWSTFLR